MIKLEIDKEIGRYRVKEFLGRGGFSLVYLAENGEGEKMALKVGDSGGGGRYLGRFLEVSNERHPEKVSPDETPAEAVFFRPDGVLIDFLDAHEIDGMLRNEAKMLFTIRHPNVVDVRECFMHEGRPVIAMKFVRGKTLREKIRALEEIRLNLFFTIVCALKKLNATGQLVYHGDLKPENIVIRPSGLPVMLDPGARMHEHGFIVTTPHYNPLLLRDSRADVMAIGIMLYEIMTGVLPFDEVPWKYAGKEPHGEIERLSLNYFLSHPPLKDLNPNMPDDFAKIVYRCLIIPEYGLEALEHDLFEFLLKK